MQTLRTLRLNRSDLVPRFMIGLEASLAAHRPRRRAQLGGAGNGRRQLPPPEPGRRQRDGRGSGAARHRRAPGIARQPDAAPARPALRRAWPARRPSMPSASRWGRDRCAGSCARPANRCSCRWNRGCCCTALFDRRVMAHTRRCWKCSTSLLARDGILPSLTFVPIRVRPTAVERPAEAAARPRPAERRRRRRSGRRAPRPRTHTAWLGAGRRRRRRLRRKRRVRPAAAIAVRAPRADRQAAPGPRPDRSRATGYRRSRSMRSATHARRPPARQPAQPARHQADAARADRASSAATARRSRAGQRHLRTAGHAVHADRTRSARATRRPSPCCASCRCRCCGWRCRTARFFVRAQHPARQLLNAVAESGARWLDDDDIDPQLVEPLQQAGRARRRELRRRHRPSSMPATATCRRNCSTWRARRRWPSAATSKRRAARKNSRSPSARRPRPSTASVGEQRLPKFVRALLNQAWADVLTLTLLRQGEDSAEWQQQLESTRRIVATCGRGGGSPTRTGGAYRGRAGAGRLPRRGSRRDRAPPDQRGRRRRRRSGLAHRTDDAPEGARAPGRGHRRRAQAEAAAAHRRRSRRTTTSCGCMPYGTWIEFVTNQQGDVVRRRLSWYSPVTDKALFVNQRGQRVGEQSLDSVGAHARARPGPDRRRRTRTPDRPRLAGDAQRAAQLRRAHEARTGRRRSTRRQRGGAP